MQTEVYPDKIAKLKNNRELLKNSSINNLNPFLDNVGLIRVGGRIRNSENHYDLKFPIKSFTN